MAPGMIIRKVIKWDSPKLEAKLAKAAEKSPKSISQICREGEITSSYWYQMVKGQKPTISYETVEKLCKSLGLALKDVGVVE